MIRKFIKSKNLNFIIKMSEIKKIFLKLYFLMGIKKKYQKLQHNPYFIILILFRIRNLRILLIILCANFFYTSAVDSLLFLTEALKVPLNNGVFFHIGELGLIMDKFPNNIHCVI